MRVTILGSGTSQGVPVIACTCPVCVSDDPRDQRLRVSIWLEFAGKSVVVDAGPDFRYQMLRANIRHLDALLLTHPHKDHIAGLDDIRAYCFRQRQAIPVYANPQTQLQLRQEFQYIFDNNYPGVPQITLHTLTHAPFELFGQTVVPLPLWHGPMQVLGFRLGKFAYLTDVNEIPEHVFPLLEGLDVLILDALRKEPHYSHFSLEEALEAAARIGARQVYLTHISHLLGRHADVSRTLPGNVALAWDGLSFDVAH